MGLFPHSGHLSAYPGQSPACSGGLRQHRRQHLVMDPMAFAACPATDVSFINFDMLIGQASDAVLIGPYHAGAQLVEDAECRLVARKPKLSLKSSRILSKNKAGRALSLRASRPRRRSAGAVPLF